MSEKQKGKTNGRPIKKGEVRNPKGSSALQRSRGVINRITIPQVCDAIGLLATHTPAEVFEISRNPKETFLRHWVAELAIKSAEKGDVKTFECLMSRCLGPPKQSVEVTGADGAAILIDKRQASMTVEDMEKRANELAARRKLIEND